MPDVASANRVVIEETGREQGKKQIHIITNNNDCIFLMQSLILVSMYCDR